MDRDGFKRLISRLISEAPKIAPSITNFDTDKKAGRVTDENLDHQRAKTWQIEADTVLQELQIPYGAAFYKLNGEHVLDKQREYHSTSVMILWTVQKLRTALDLLDSEVATMGVGPPVRQGAPIQFSPIEAEGETAPKAGSSLEAPEKVTISWLLRHVPVSVWLGGLVLLGSAFALGVRMADVPAFRVFLKALSGEH